MHRYFQGKLLCLFIFTSESCLRVWIEKCVFTPHVPPWAVTLCGKLGVRRSGFLYFACTSSVGVCVRVRMWGVFCRNGRSPECHRKPLRSVSGAWEGSVGLLRQRRVEEQVSRLTSLKNRSIVAVRKQLTAGKNHSRSASRHTHANKCAPSGKKKNNNKKSIHTLTHTNSFVRVLVLL